MSNLEQRILALKANLPAFTHVSDAAEVKQLQEERDYYIDSVVDMIRSYPKTREVTLEMLEKSVALADARFWRLSSGFRSIIENIENARAALERSGK